jgi:hypothetical protein
MRYTGSELQMYNLYVYMLFLRIFNKKKRVSQKPSSNSNDAATAFQ